jgi:hypothetical protein
MIAARPEAGFYGLYERIGADPLDAQEDVIVRVSEVGFASGLTKHPDGYRGRSDRGFEIRGLWKTRTALPLRRRIPRPPVSYKSAGAELRDPSPPDYLTGAGGAVGEQAIVALESNDPIPGVTWKVRARRADDRAVAAAPYLLFCPRVLDLVLTRKRLLCARRPEDIHLDSWNALIWSSSVSYGSNLAIRTKRTKGGGGERGDIVLFV